MARQELSENIPIPGVKARLVAFEVESNPNYSFDELLNLGLISGNDRWFAVPRPKNVQVDWRIELTVPGPDARYKPGRAWISASEIEGFTTALQIALQKIEALRDLPHGATFKSELSFSANRSSLNPLLYVLLEVGSAMLQMQLPTGTMLIAKNFNFRELRSLITEIEALPKKAVVLTTALKNML